MKTIFLKNAREHSFKRLYEEHKHAGPELQIPDEEALKIKIKSIKDCYRIELNKIKKSRKSGCGTDDVYKPKLVWFNRAVACPASAHASRINRFMTFRCPFGILAVFATFKILINRLVWPCFVANISWIILAANMHVIASCDHV